MQASSNNAHGTSVWRQGWSQMAADDAGWRDEDQLALIKLKCRGFPELQPYLGGMQSLAGTINLGQCHFRSRRAHE